MLWRRLTSLVIDRKLRFKQGATILVDNAAGVAATEISLAELKSINDLAGADLAKIDGITNGTPAAAKALVLDANLGIGAFRQTGRNLRTQAAPAAKTTTTTLTAAEIIAGLLTANQGGGAAATYTMPLGTDLETALIAAHPGLQNDDSFEFTIVNISTNAAEDVTVAGNTGTTAVGNMTIASNAAVADQAWGTFRVRRTGQNLYSFYRVG